MISFFGGKSNHIDHTFSVSTWTFIHAFCAKLAASFFVNQKENSDVGSIPIRYQNPDTSSTISWSVPEAWPAKWHYALHSSSFLSLLCKVRPSTSVRIMMLLKMYQSMVVVLKMYHKGNDGSPVHGLAKRRPEMGAQGFTGDSFNGESWDKQN